VIFPILLFIFSKKYRWTGWAQKLTGKIENQATKIKSPDESDNNL